jgi:hypothetical protein
MLHEIRNIQILENNSKGFQFDYRGRQMIFLTNSTNERLEKCPSNLYLISSFIQTFMDEKSQ